MQSDDLTSVIRNVDNISFPEFKKQANLICLIHIRMNVLFQMAMSVGFNNSTSHIFVSIMDL